MYNLKSVLQILSSNIKASYRAKIIFNHRETSLKCYKGIHYFADELLCEAVPRTRRPTKLRAKQRVTSHESLPASIVYNSESESAVFSIPLDT